MTYICIEAEVHNDSGWMDGEPGGTEPWLRLSLLLPVDDPLLVPGHSTLEGRYWSINKGDKSKQMLTGKHSNCPHTDWIGSLLDIYMYVLIRNINNSLTSLLIG